MEVYWNQITFKKPEENMSDLNMDDLNDTKTEPTQPSHARTTEPGTAVPPREIPVHRGFEPGDVETNKFVAALSYIGILFLVPLLVKPKSPFAQFHAKQGLVLAVIFFIGSFVFWIPPIGWIAFLFLVVVDLMALVKTLQGQAWEIPVVKNIVAKLNI